MRRVLAVGAAVIVVVSALVACTPEEQNVATATVGIDGFNIELGGVEASAGTDVAPEGTLVTLKLSQPPAAGGLAEHTTALAHPVSLTLGEGLQPETPIALRFKIDEAAVSDEEWAVPETLLVATQSEDGTVSLLKASKDGEYLTAETDHLSFFQPIQLDLHSALNSAKDFVMQSLGLETAEPDCVGGVAKASTGVEYSIPYRGWLHPCIAADDDTITVNLYTATMMPYRAKSWPAVSGQTVTAPDSQSMLLTLMNKWTASPTGGTALGAGASAQFSFDASNPPQFFEARQDASMLIGAVLLNLIGIVLNPLGGGAAFMDKLGELDCLSGTVSAGLSDEFDATTAAEIVRTTLACVGTIAGSAPFGVRLALAIIGAVPALFAGSFVGIANELSGAGTVRIDVESSVTPWSISADGIGPFRVGKTTWNDVSSMPRFEGDDSGWSDVQCAAGGWHDTGTIYDGVGVLTAGDIAAPGPLDVITINAAPRTGVAASVPVSTKEGLKLGASQADVERLYPFATSQQHPLSDAITEYRVVNDSGRAMIIGVEDSAVSYIAVGNVPEVDYPEGCV